MSPLFSGHETFPLRFTWLAKSVEACQENPRVFADPDAIAVFGVGRNMVRAIRHWGLATDVLGADPDGSVRPTPFGRAAFGPDGWDPYCEDPATAWALHWHLCRTAGRAALWHVVFGHWRGGALDLRALRPALDAWLDDPDALPSESTLKRDLHCLAASYAPPSPRQDPEDAVTCPFTALGLLYADAGTLYPREGRKESLPPAVFAYAVRDHWARRRPGADALPLADVLEAPGSPGRAFLLSDAHAYDLLRRAEALPGAPFRYDSTAGIRQLYLTDREAAPTALLAAHYAPAEA